MKTYAPSINLKPIITIKDKRLSSLLVKQPNNNISLLELVKKLKIPKNNYECRSLFKIRINQSQGRYSYFFQDLKDNKLIKDLVGFKEKLSLPIVFSTLVTHQPKVYLLMYFSLLAAIKQRFPKTRTIIYFETWFSRYFFQKTSNSKAYLELIKTIEKSTGKIVDQIFFTENISKNMCVPAFFIQETLSKIGISDFISILPYSKHRLDNIRLTDLLHFIWNLYSIYLIPGTYLTSINSKREFLTFRKALKKDRLSIAFLPKAPEEMDSHKAHSFYKQYLDFGGMTHIYRQLQNFL